MKFTSLFVGIICILITGSLSSRNAVRGKKFNVCRKMSFYERGASNPYECWYNPDVDSYAHDIIKRHGYTFEYYKVISEDNYITTLFRIPSGKDHSSSNNNRQPVFLLHGFATSAHNMVDIGKDCLAFALADAGYDVWLGNMRGSSYSLGHTNMTYKNQRYWKFSFHEIGKYDMPATLKLISNHTQGRKIIFMGHSLAASVFHVFESSHRQLSKETLSGAILVAPVVYLTNIQPLHPELEGFEDPLMVLATLMGLKRNSSDVQQVLSYKKFLCKQLPVMLQACTNGFYLAFGLRSPNIPPHYIPMMLAHNPSGFSVTTLNHMLQISHNDGTFQEYDYGVAKNQEKYGDVFPPEYDVQGCATPVFVFSGSGDWISTERDVEKLLGTIPGDKVKGKYKIKAAVWKHYDYFYGKYVARLFYHPLLQTLRMFHSDAVANPKNKEDVGAKPTNVVDGFPTTVPGITKLLADTTPVLAEETFSTVVTSPISQATSISSLGTFGTSSTLFSNSRVMPKTTSKVTRNNSLVTKLTADTTPALAEETFSTVVTSPFSQAASIFSLGTFGTASTLFSNSRAISETTSKVTSNNSLAPTSAASPYNNTSATFRPVTPFSTPGVTKNVRSTINTAKFTPSSILLPVSTQCKEVPQKPEYTNNPLFPDK